MNKFIIIAFIVLILAIIGGYVYMDTAHKKEVRGLNETISFKQLALDSCYTSKEKVKIDSFVVEVPQYIKITKLMPVDSFLVYSVVRDRLGGNKPLETLIRAYKDTLTNKDFSLPYELTVNGYLGSVTFGNYNINKTEKTIEHIVKVPYKVIQEVNKNHLYIYGMFGSSFGVSQDYSYEAGLNFVIKKKFGIMGGYQRFGKMDIFKIGFNIKLL